MLCHCRLPVADVAVALDVGSGSTASASSLATAVTTPTSDFTSGSPAQHVNNHTLKFYIYQNQLYYLLKILNKQESSGHPLRRMSRLHKLFQ